MAAWLQIRDYFDEVVPLFWYLVPDLEFELESLDYFEKFFGCKIHRYPHPSLNRMLNAFTFQPPEHCAVIEAAELPDVTHDDSWDVLCEELKIERVPNATGVRAADTPLRRMAYDKWGLYRVQAKTYMPVGDWNKARVLEAIKKSGLKLPIDYEWFNRSFDGIDYRFMSKLKTHAPREFQKILDWFPLIEADLFRYEQMGFRP